MKNIAKMTPAEMTLELRCLQAKIERLEEQIACDPSAEVLKWIDANPEAIERIAVRKHWGRKVWWRGPDGHDCDTLKECVLRAIRAERRP